ncbi:BnaA05g16030D [Brassica napus]|uniref:(rape) hypothetical protein n=1 Tax=Brassica napus TaxID=3708 RepID=A0A078GUX6_BRANA|nr:unnamed protein product [Brassica napus]CDY29336.1 BnaA05g16030D [Brassica napus]
MLSFEPKDRLTSEELFLYYNIALADPYFKNLAKPTNFMYPRACVLYPDNNHAVAQQSLWKSLMDSPSVASEIQSDRVVLTGEFLFASLKLSKVSCALCLI